MSFVADEDLKEEFETFGFDISNDLVIEKLQELCALHRLSAERITAEWTAFAKTKKDIPLSVENLDLFDREILKRQKKYKVSFQKKNEKLGKGSQKTPKTPLSSKSRSNAVFNIDSIQGVNEDDAEDLYHAYSKTPSSKSSVSQKRQLTPDNPPVKRFINSVRSPAAPFSPASFSPAGATPSKKYSSRSNAGDVVASFGVTDNTSWQGQGQGCTVSVFKPEGSRVQEMELKEISHDFKYMFQKLTVKAMVLNDLIDDMASQLEKKHQIEEVGDVTAPAQEDVTVIGRIFCDSEGKLNAKSVMIEGSRDTSGGRAMAIDLSNLKQYSLFPGQVVAMDGTNPTGQKFVAKKLYEGVQLPFPVTDQASGPVNLSVFVGVGPFSTSDNLDYEPLKDLIKYLQRDRPDVCILTGPFVDMKNEIIEGGKCPVIYDEIFDQQMKSIAQVTKSIGCQVIVVPSFRDVHHDNVYPQPPFMASDKNSHIHFVPDPSMVSINGIVFGITSTDVLFHLGSEEISCNPAGSTDRLGRLAHHMITQQSFYPLSPPSEDVSIDHEAFELQALMSVTPHILITPSDLKQFIKDLNGCCCINPGRLTRGQSGGTFARLNVTVNNLASNSSLIQNIKAQVVRV